MNESLVVVVLILVLVLGVHMMRVRRGKWRWKNIRRIAIRHWPGRHWCVMAIEMSEVPADMKAIFVLVEVGVWEG